MQIEPATTSDIPALSNLLDQLFAREAEFTPDHAAQQRSLERVIMEKGTDLFFTE